MNIGIITQPLYRNYGGILQNWALQQVLKDMGHKPITVDYGLKCSLIHYILSSGKTVLYRFQGKHREFLSPPRYGRYGSKYTCEFIQHQITKTRPVNLLSSALLKEYGVEAIIVGSDQVWRPMCNSIVEDMFLSFADDFLGKRIAYGASFGTDEWEFSEEQTEHCRKLVKRFDAVSVREDSGMDLCHKYFNIDALAVLDPTLLLSKAHYETLCQEVPSKKEEFIAVYCLDITAEKQEVIKKVSQKLNMPMRLFSADRNLKLTVEQWLAMFRDAAFVVTDSFHGTVFSLIFHKPFYLMLNKKRGASRFESLFSKLNLTVQMNEECLIKEIDWALVDSKLQLLRDKSLNYLKCSLS